MGRRSSNRRLASRSILITGGHGMAGSYFLTGIRPGRKALDITNLQSVRRAMQRYRPKVVIHLAAETDLALCEAQPDLAFRVNTLGTYYIASEAAAVGARMVYLSTDAVFRGTKRTPYFEDDLPNPRGAYGLSKYLGEIATLAFGTDPLIIRTSWLFGGGPARDYKFIGKAIPLLLRGDMSAAGDQIGSPTFAKDLAKAVYTLIGQQKTGIVHVANKGRVSRYDIARLVAKRIRSQGRVRRVRARTFGKGVAAFSSALASRRVHLRGWESALADYLRSEWSAVLK